jgi:outer membrane lipoprotein-sorting protein
MKKRKLIYITTFLFSLFSVLPSALIAQELSGLQIMVKEDTREDGDDQTSRGTFHLINKRGHKRLRETIHKWKDYDGRDGFKEKDIIIFHSPQDIKGTGFLNWSYPDINKDDDQWLYLPALRKVRRISANDKEDSFVGTDFTFDDMGEREVEEDTHKLIRQEIFEDKKCCVVESMPKEKNYIYSKKLIWVIDGEWIVSKIEFYDRKGKFLKELHAQWQKVQEIWAWQNISMKNAQTGHQTIIEVRDIKFNQGLSDRVFTRRTLIREGK